MKIIISPSKTFKKTEIPYQTIPLFQKQTDLIHQKLSQLSLDAIKEGFHVSDKLASIIYQDYHTKQLLSPAIFLYDGISYKALNPQHIKHLDDTLNILSAYYGILKPFDGIMRYRLDFNQGLVKDLYHFWKPLIKQYIETLDETLIIDLTSLEFSKVLPVSENIYRIDFINLEKRISSVEAKKMRGTFAFRLLENPHISLADIKLLQVQGFSYDASRSTKNLLIFSKTNNIT